MRTIQIENMTYSYTGHYKPVFDKVNLMIDTEWKLGLIGRNGRGKTTLLNLIHGNLSSDKGNINKQIATEIFPYDYSKNYKNTMDLIKDNVGPYFQLEEEMARRLKGGSEADFLAYADLVHQYNEIDGYEIESLIRREFNLMAMPVALLDREFLTLSGGEKTKALIIALFLRKDHFMLLDEPTNHLDVAGKLSLANYLSKKKGFIIVSHDRQFLDMTVDHILSINKGNIYIEKGSFSSWNDNRMMTESFELRKRDGIQRNIQVMERAAKQSRRFSDNKEAKKVGKVDRGFVGARAARLMKRAKNIEKRQSEQLAEQKDLLKNYEQIPLLTIKQEACSQKKVISIQNLNYTIGERSLIKNLNLQVEKGDRVWIKGANGTGKSSLLNMIRGRITDYEGYVKVHHPIKVSESYQDPIWQEGMLDTLLKEDKIDYNIFRITLAYFDMLEDYFERPLETFSQGELKKIDIARALSVENQVIILDEPLNYMDMYFRQQLEAAILHYQPTIIFVEHDVYFGESIATKTVNL